MIETKGKLLIAMPGMGDPRFYQAVIYMCEHSEKGAMGLIINAPVPSLSFSDLLSELDITSKDNLARYAQDCVHFGGPVESSRGYILHSSDYQSSIQTLNVQDGFAMTATLDILEDIAGGTGPSQKLMMLGYAGWGPMQLEAEIAQNAWLTADAEADLVFNLEAEQKWGAALESLGVDPRGLSAAAGRA